MTENLQFSKLLTIGFSNAMIELCHKARTAGKDTLLVDLSRTTFVTPFGIVLLAGTISEVLSNNKKAEYIEPRDVKTKRFLQGIGFNKFFNLTREPYKIESPNVQLRCLKKIDYFLTDQILEVFKSSISMSEGVQGSLKMALNELMTNVFDHSESRKGCYVCAQTYPQAGHIRLCVADFGIGILASLKKVSKYKSLRSDYDGIKLAIQEGVTSRKQGGAGKGLDNINRFVKVNEGKLYILSGRGKVLWNYSDPKKPRIEEQTMSLPFDGTLIELEINVDKQGFYFLTSESF